jgi:transcriptional regulator with XRE-family HTH domain
MNVRTANYSSEWLAMTSRRTPTPSDMDLPGADVGGRLRLLREARKMNQEAVAERLGISRTQISKYESGKHALPDYLVPRAAQLFAVAPAYIRYGDADSHMAEVVGRVGAGSRIEAIAEQPSRYVEVPASWKDAIALEVRGSSCYPTYDDGDDIVIRGEPRLVEDEIMGRMCVVETSDGIGLVKRVRRGSAGGLFTLESPNAPTLEDVPLRSARPVRLHVPR